MFATVIMALALLNTAGFCEDNAGIGRNITISGMEGAEGESSMIASATAPFVNAGRVFRAVVMNGLQRLAAPEEWLFKFTDSDWAANLGEFLEESRELDRAIEHYDELINRDPKPKYYLERSVLHLEKARFFNDLGFIDKAKPDYMKAAEDFNRSGKYWDNAHLKVEGWIGGLKKWRLNMNRLTPAAFAVDTIERNVEIKKGDSVADLGVGPGYYLFYFASLVGGEGRVYAVDIDPHCLEFIRRVNKSREYPNVKYVHSTFTDTKLPKDSVDVVFLRFVPIFDEDSFEMRPESARGIAKSIHNSLMPGGRMFIMDRWVEDEESESDRKQNVLVKNVEGTGLFKLKKHVRDRDVAVFVFEKAED